MSEASGFIRPDTVFRRHLEDNLSWKSRQDAGIHAAICILGTTFYPVEGPSPRMRARMALALNLIRNSKEPVRLIASGGAIGTGGEIITEAQLIDITLRSLGIPKLYREDFSQESIGNVAWTALGLFQPLQIDRATFVTDELHAPRIKAIACHLLSGKVTVEVAAAPWPLSEQEKADEVQREVDGWKFIERFLEEVPPGELIGAIEWVSENHKSFPYLGIEVEDIVAVIRGQMLDFNTAIGFGDAALPVAA